MAITNLTNNSPGAPQLYSTAASIIPVLDFLLVTSMGWTKPFVYDIHSSVYRAPTGNRFFYQFVHTGTFGGANSGVGVFTSAFSDMTAWDTGSDRTSFTGIGFSLSTAGVTGSHCPYSFFSDGKICYLFVYLGTSWVFYVFGDFVSYRPGDAYASIIAGVSGYGGTAAAQSLQTTPLGVDPRRTVRGINQISTNTPSSFMTNYTFETSLGASSITSPSMASGGLMLMPVLVGETGAVRGYLPGIFSPLTPSALSSGDIFSGTGPMAGRNFIVHPIGSSGKICIETSDTWRI